MLVRAEKQFLANTWSKCGILGRAEGRWWSQSQRRKAAVHALQICLGLVSTSTPLLKASSLLHTYVACLDRLSSASSWASVCKDLPLHHSVSLWKPPVQSHSKYLEGLCDLVGNQWLWACCFQLEFWLWLAVAFDCQALVYRWQCVTLVKGLQGYSF